MPSKNKGKNAAKPAPKPQKPESKVLNFTSPLESAPYNPKDFGEGFTGSVVLSLGGASILMERIVHHPIGGHTLAPTDWVISSRNEIINLLRTRDNPFVQEITKALWQQCQAVLVEKKLLVINKTDNISEVFLVGDGKNLLLEIMRKDAKACRADLLSELEGLKPIKKGGAPPKMPSIDVDVFMGYMLRKPENAAFAKAVAGIQLSADNGLKSAFIKSLPKSPHRSYLDDMNEREQVAVADLRGVSDRDIMPALMKKVMGVTRQQPPAAAKTAANDVKPPPDAARDVKEEKVEFTMETYVDYIKSLGKVAMSNNLKEAYFSDKQIAEKVEKNSLDGQKFAEDCAAYPALYEEYKGKAEAAAAERKKRYEQMAKGEDSGEE